MATTTTGTTDPLGLWLFSVIPVVLLVTSSILLDRVLYYEALLQRSQIQVGMWLALFLATSITLQMTNVDSIQPQIICLVWAHLTIFSNLLAIFVEGLQKKCSTRHKALELGFSVLPFSCWCSVIVVASCVLTNAITNAAVPNIDSLWKWSVLAFGGTLLAVWFLKVFAIRRKAMSHDLQGMPTIVTNTAEDSNPVVGGGILARLCGMTPATSINHTKSRTQANPWLDERQWYTWSRVQTMKWFAQQLKATDEPERVLSILHAQSITGEVLDNLSISQLVALKVPFGPAVLLSNAVAGLVDRTPKPRILNGVLQRTRREPNSASNDCLDLHDNEYNNQEQQRSPPTMNHQPMEELQQVVPQNPAPIPEQQPIDYSGGGGGMSEEQHEKLNQVMKDRFGLELPKLRATDFLAVQKGLNNKNNGRAPNGPPIPHENTAQSQVFHPLDDAPPSSSAPPSLRNNYYANTAPTSAPAGPSFTPTAATTGIPQNILQGMPPHLQEIAKRRPDLAETIWKRKQQTQQQRQQQQPKSQSSTKRYQDLPALPEENQFEDELDSDNEDETTSLILRDHDPSRYKSVDKVAFPGIV